MTCSASTPLKGQCRVVIKFLSTNVPGEPIKRHILLREAYCDQMLGRRFNKETDYDHVPGGFDEDNYQCWLVLDFNVKESPLSLDAIPLVYLKATYDGEGHA